MFKLLVQILFLLFSFNYSAQAYEFKKIDRFFAGLEHNYNGQIDYKQLTVLSGSLLGQYDTNIHLYNSDTKAFLYEKNNLIKTFKFPQSSESEKWVKILTEILMVGADNSAKISYNAPQLESAILQKVANTLDPYTRIENEKKDKLKLLYDFIEDILYVKVENFYDGFSEEFKQVISKTPHIEGIILDLRGNRGGKLNEAIQTSNLFLDTGIITYCKENRQPTRYYTATQGDIFNGGQIIILTDEYTASAAEIVVAALSEQSRALIIGTQTFGKGTLQRIDSFDDTTIFITSGYFYSPSGKHINHQGIMPTICTGIDGSCLISDKNNPSSDISLAISLIKKNLS